MSQHNGLKLADLPGSRDKGRRIASLVAGGVILLVLGASTWLGAGTSGDRQEMVDLANEALAISLEEGSRSSGVTARLQKLRSELARRPLDANTRSIYASLLLGLSRSTEETGAAVFHAARAAELAPVTVPVQRRVTQILARCGEMEHALQLTSRTFQFDPAAGARILESLLPICGPVRAVQGIPDEAAAWMAWSRTLERTAGQEEAYALAVRAWKRWPADPGVLLYLASRALWRGDLEHLKALFPDDLALPDDPNHALLFSFQAAANATIGDRVGVERSIGRALELVPDNPSVLRTAGDAWKILDEPDEAAGLWNRALFHARNNRSTQLRLEILLRLARLEDERGRTMDALDFWRNILKIKPDHPEARKRVDDLTGFRH